VRSGSKRTQPVSPIPLPTLLSFAPHKLARSGELLASHTAPRKNDSQLGLQKLVNTVSPRDLQSWTGRVPGSHWVVTPVSRSVGVGRIKPSPAVTLFIEL